MTTAAEWLAKHGHKSKSSRVEDVEALPAPDAVPAIDLPGGEAPLSNKVRAAVADGKAHGRKDAKEQATAASQAVREDILSAGRVAIDQYGVARYLTFQGPRYVALRLDGQEFRDFCQTRAIETQGRPLGRDTIAAFVEALRGRAVRDGVRCTVYTRVALETSEAGESTYFLDLANDAGEMVRISARGWTIEHNDHVAFLANAGPLPHPVEPADVDQSYHIVRDFLVEHGVARDLALVLTVAVLEWMRPNTAYPVLDIIGPAGGGKTALARALVSLLDPTKSGKLAEVKLEEEHLGAISQSAHVLVADNTSRLSAEVQNLVCRVCYGTEYVARKYYTQAEVERLPIHNPIIITSIIPAITAPDLQARAIRVALKPRHQYESQIELSRRCEAERAAVLGALLTLFSAGLAQIDVTQTWPHRFVDFVQLGEAVGRALGEPPGHFSNLLTELSRRTAREYAEGDDLAVLLLKVLRDASQRAVSTNTLPPFTSWSHGQCAVQLANGITLVAFTPQALLDALTRETTMSPSAYNLPRSARGVGPALTLRTPTLTALGIKAEQRNVGHGRRTVWTFMWHGAPAW